MSRQAKKGGQVFKIRPVLEHYDFDHWPESLGWVAIRCRFHDDSSASASVIEHADGSGGFNCHTCGIKGDAIEIIKMRENGVETFGQAVRFIEEVTGEKVSGVSRKSSTSSGGRTTRLSGRRARPDNRDAESLSDRRRASSQRRRSRS